MSSFFVPPSIVSAKCLRRGKKKETSIMSTCFRKRKVTLQHASEIETSEGVSPERKEGRRKKEEKEEKNDPHDC